MTEYELKRLALIAHAGCPPRKTLIVVAEANLIAGTIVGRVTATRKIKGYLVGSVDGSQVPVGVLLEDAPAALADVKAVVGFAGSYAKANVIGLDQAGEDVLEGRGLYFV